MSQEESENCRYCLEPLDCELGDIFDPCRCKSKVHRKCFIHWLETRPFDPFDEQSVLEKCEICKSKYKRRYRKYITKVFKKRSLIVELRNILYHEQLNGRNPRINTNNRNNNEDSNYSCFIVWFGLFFTMMIIFSFDSNYNPNYSPNTTIEYNNTY